MGREGVTEAYLGPNLSTRIGGKDSELDACLHSGVGVKGTESGGKGRSIRRPFHPRLLLSPLGGLRALLLATISASHLNGSGIHVAYS